MADPIVVLGREDLRAMLAEAAAEGARLALAGAREDLRRELADLRASVERSDPAEPKVYENPKGLAKRFGVSERLVRDCIARGDLPALRVGRRVRVSVAEAERVFSRRAGG